LDARRRQLDQMIFRQVRLDCDDKVAVAEQAHIRQRYDGESEFATMQRQADGALLEYLGHQPTQGGEKISKAGCCVIVVIGHAGLGKAGSLTESREVAIKLNQLLIQLIGM